MEKECQERFKGITMEDTNGANKSYIYWSTRH